MKSKKLRKLLTERHALFNKQCTNSKGIPNKSPGVMLRPLRFPLVGPPEPLGRAMPFSFIEQINREPFVQSVGTWLKYFRCFELQKKGTESNVEAVAAKIYRDDPEDPVINAKQGIKRVKQLIKAALNDTLPTFR